MSKAKRKGSSFEGQVASYLATALDCDIERRALAGTNDRGDISGLLINGKRTVVECKAEKSLRVPEYLREAEAERQNDFAKFGVVVSKRRGVGEANMGDQLVLMTLDTFCRIVKEFMEPTDDPQSESLETLMGRADSIVAAFEEAAAKIKEIQEGKEYK